MFVSIEEGVVILYNLYQDNPSRIFLKGETINTTVTSATTATTATTATKSN